MAEVEVTENRTTVSVVVGDEIVVRLAENAGTGYQWNVDQLTGPLEVVSSELVPAGPPGGLPPGAASERFVRLAATAAGEGAVRLTLGRVWETEPQDRFEVRIVVSTA